MPNDDRTHQQNSGHDGSDHDTSKNLMDNVMMMLMANASEPDVTHLNDLGQIRQMSIPGGWEAGPDYTQMQHSASYKEFHPQGDSDCQLGFYYRGLRTSESAGKSFHELLNQAPHYLAKDELATIQEIIRDKANPNDFKTSAAYTADLNGKRVLVLEGRYNAIQQDAKHIFVDSDDTGTAIQEIFFQAPADKFQKYMKAANDSMQSIMWK